MTGSLIEGFAGYRMLQRRLAAAAQRGVTALPFFRPRDGVSGSIVCCDGREFIDYSGYNYLGLSGHLEVSAAAKRAIDRYGTSASASRIVSGQIGLHDELERRIAAFLGTEDCIVLVSGYLTNVTLIDHLLSRRDVVVYDSAAHNSIISGCRLAEAETLRYPCEDWEALDRVLMPARARYRRGLLIAEGVYSMDGSVLDLGRAVAAKRRHDLLLMVDEAHSFGTLGGTGRGICERAGVPPGQIDIHMGTLSKALASCGGYVAGDRALVEYLRYLAPGFIFSVGLSPPDTAAALAALEVLEREPERPRGLQDRARRFRQLAREQGLELTGTEDAPVASLVVGNEERCMLLSQRLLDRGIRVPAIVYPAVPHGVALLRFFVTVTHTEEQLRATLVLLARELEVVGCRELAG